MRVATVVALLLWSISAPDIGSVKIPTPSGVPLDGRFADAGRGAPGVLLFPMCRADAMNGWAPIVERLLTSGVSSLQVIYRQYAGPEARVTGDQRSADADAALAYLRSRVGEDARLAIAGSSCGVYHALSTAARQSQQVRAVIALTGPHTPAHVEFVRGHGDVAVFSGTATEDVPAPDWARELKAVSPNPASRMALADGKAHGTDIFMKDPAYTDQLARWIASQVKGRPAPQ